MATGPEVDHDVLHRQVLTGNGQLGDGNGAPVGGETRTYGLVVAEGPAQLRPQPVGGQHHRSLVGALGQHGGGAVLAAVDPGDRRVGAQVDAGALAGCVQDLMEVAAVDDDVGRAIAGTEVCAEVEVGEFRAVDGIAEDQPTG